MEFVKLSSQEKTYTEKSILEIQAQFISVLQHLSKYHSARDEELKLKLALRNKIEESKEFLETFDKSLPKSQFKDDKAQQIKVSQVKTLSSSPIYESALPIRSSQEETKEDKLQRELEEIKRKLSRL